jgi:hypothetical protein
VSRFISSKDSFGSLSRTFFTLPLPGKASIATRAQCLDVEKGQIVGASATSSVPRLDERFERQTNKQTQTVPRRRPTRTSVFAFSAGFHFRSEQHQFVLPLSLIQCRTRQSFAMKAFRFLYFRLNHRSLVPPLPVVFFRLKNIRRASSLFFASTVFFNPFTVDTELLDLHSREKRRDAGSSCTCTARPIAAARIPLITGISFTTTFSVLTLHPRLTSGCTNSVCSIFAAELLSFPNDN